jgi:hypothetical protein
MFLSGRDRPAVVATECCERRRSEPDRIPCRTRDIHQVSGPWRRCCPGGTRPGRSTLCARIDEDAGFPGELFEFPFVFRLERRIYQSLV